MKNLEKTKVFIPISGKKEAKFLKKVLLACGEEVSPIYQEEMTHLYFTKNNKEWVFSYGYPDNTTQITPKQLMEILSKEVKKHTEIEEDKTFECAVCERETKKEDRNSKRPNICLNCYNAENPKIAVEVRDDFEYNQTYKHLRGASKCYYTTPRFICLDKKGWYLKGENAIEDGYKIISYQDFAKEHGLEVKPTEIDLGWCKVYADKVRFDSTLNTVYLDDVEKIHKAMQQLK